MSKRTLKEEEEVNFSPTEAKKAFLEVNSSENELKDEKAFVGEDIHASESVEESNEDFEETELEMRDLLLEESSVGITNSGRDQREHTFKVIKLKGELPDLSLPNGWIALCHRSGGIVYLHRPTRVCTWARPYHIGDASVRKHDVPIAAIPCLHQCNALKSDAEKQKAGGQEASSRPSDCHDKNPDEPMPCDGAGNTMKPEINGGCDDYNKPNNKVDCGSCHGNCDGTISDQDIDGIGHDGEQSPSNIIGANGDNSDGSHGNCGNNFDDQSINVSNHDNHDENPDNHNVSCRDSNSYSQRLFNVSHGKIEMATSSDISAYLAKLWEFQEIDSDEDRLPIMGFKGGTEDNEETKCSELHATIPYLVQGLNPRVKAKDKLAINPAGKSPQSLLHEYCTKILKLKPTYKTGESGNPKLPFVATVEIDGLQYGSGSAVSKRLARHIAAQATLDVFMPGTYEKLLNVDEQLKVFDNVPIEDPSVYELTTRLGLMSPFQILNECVKRNQGVLMSNPKFEMHHTPNQKIFYTIECGKHKATGPCRNKKTGRELASQALLQKLHPHLKNWGSLLRIYVDQHTVKSFTKTNDTSVSTVPDVNKELLGDLKCEMWKLLKSKKSNQSSNILTKITDIIV